MPEEWRAVEENHNYEVSDLGNVRHVERRGRVMNGRDAGKGYVQVNIHLAGVAKQHYVHRLVCAAFHGPQPEGMPEVDHINYVRGDNRADNLRWISQADNNAHSLHRLARGIDKPNAKLTDENVREIRRVSYTKGLDTIFAARFGVSPAAISDARRGKTWRHIDE